MPHGRHHCARILANMVKGVSEGYERKLELVGVGYRAAVQGKDLNLTLGFLASGAVPIPEGITIETPTQTEILIKGTDKQRVGQVAAEIRALPSAGAVQGQGRAVRRREDHPEGSQEEVIRPDGTSPSAFGDKTMHKKIAACAAPSARARRSASSACRA